MANIKFVALTTPDIEGNSFSFEVELVSYRWSFGRWDYLVRPVAGVGEKFISEGNLKPDNFRSWEVVRKQLPKYEEDGE